MHRLGRPVLQQAPDTRTGARPHRTAADHARRSVRAYPYAPQPGPALPLPQPALPLLLPWRLGAPPGVGRLPCIPLTGRQTGVLPIFGMADRNPTQIVLDGAVFGWDTGVLSDYAAMQPRGYVSKNAGWRLCLVVRCNTTDEEECSTWSKFYCNIGK